jgi:hypothetical protein
LACPSAALPRANDFEAKDVDTEIGTPSAVNDPETPVVETSAYIIDGPAADLWTSKVKTTPVHPAVETK